ncbi:MAG: cation diffusion facilitator family transporter, partial [Bacteroidota bacterium]
VIIAVLSGSAVMLAQALRGGADLLTAGLLLVGLNRSRQRADRSHRFGYGREIYFWTLISALMLLSVTATVAFYNGWQHFFAPPQISNIPIALIILIFGTVTNGYALSLSYRRLKGSHAKQSIWKAFFASALIETKAAFVLDLMGTLGGIFGLSALGLFLLTGNVQFDGLGAMLIGLSTGILAIFLVIDVKDLLVGRSASLELEDEIRKTALAVKGVDDVLDLRTMYIGSERLLVNMELDLQPHLATEQIERLIDIIKAEVKDKVPSVHHIQVELETPHRK